MTEDTKMIENSHSPEESPEESGQPSPALGETVQGMSLAFSTRVTIKMENLLERLDELLEIEARLAEAEPPSQDSTHSN